MRTNIIPAQITTVEDKIAGNLSFTQIILLLGSLFLSVFIYAAVPTKLEFTTLKIILILITLTLFSTLSLRTKDRIILSWLALLVSYYIRPKVFVFDKNSTYLRKGAGINTKKNNKKPGKLKFKIENKNENADVYPVFIEDLLKNPETGFSFKFRKKGGLNVSVSEK
jgi:hypothetical protein